MVPNAAKPELKVTIQHASAEGGMCRASRQFQQDESPQVRYMLCFFLPTLRFWHEKGTAPFVVPDSRWIVVSLAPRQSPRHSGKSHVTLHQTRESGPILASGNETAPPRDYEISLVGLPTPMHKGACYSKN